MFDLNLIEILVASVIGAFIAKVLDASGFYRAASRSLSSWFQMENWIAIGATIFVSATLAFMIAPAIKG